MTPAKMGPSPAISASAQHAQRQEGLCKTECRVSEALECGPEALSHERAAQLGGPLSCEGPLACTVPPEASASKLGHEAMPEELQVLSPPQASASSLSQEDFPLERGRPETPQKKTELQVLAKQEAAENFGGGPGQTGIQETQPDSGGVPTVGLACAGAYVPDEPCRARLHDDEVPGDQETGMSYADAVIAGIKMVEPGHEAVQLAEMAASAGTDIENLMSFNYWAGTEEPEWKEKEWTGGFPPGEWEKYLAARRGRHNRRLGREMRVLKAEQKAAKEAREKKRKRWDVRGDEGLPP
eukprot:jgi/Botrbrau1/5534/Bobra.0023s0021.4